MKTYSITIIVGAALITACVGDFNPCYPSPLYLGLSDEEKASCDECDDYQGCDQADAGETGGEPEPVDELMCDGQFQEDGDSFMCFVGNEAPVPKLGSIDWAPTNADDCHFLAGPVPCNRSWSEPANATGDECVLCEVATYGAVVKQPDQNVAGWEICRNDPNGFHADDHPYYPAMSNDWDDDHASQILPNWLDEQTCFFPGDYTGHTCDLVMISASAKGYAGVTEMHRSEWTCACETDDDCQPGAVCEAGWTMDGGFMGLPHPTLCTWDDGTPNGAAPEGPVVYGLDAWSDGITFDGRTATVTPAMFIEATFGGAALWDDGQRFEVLDFGLDDGVADISITACDPDALCSFLGLGVGVVVSAPINSMDMIADGRPVDVDVSSERANYIITVVVE